MGQSSLCAVVVVVLLVVVLVLGTKQSQEMYLAGPSLPPLLSNTSKRRPPFLPSSSRATSAEAELIIDVNLVIMNSLPVTAMCTEAPEWVLVWFCQILDRSWKSCVIVKLVCVN